MRAIRRLPPFLRALWVLGHLALLTDTGVLAWWFPNLHEDDLSLGSHVAAILLALLLLVLACTLMIAAYNLRFERPGRSAPWPDSWRVQLTVVLALAALPLCSLVFALVVPPSPSMFDILFALQILSILVLATASIWVFVRYYG